MLADVTMNGLSWRVRIGSQRISKQLCRHMVTALMLMERTQHGSGLERGINGRSSDQGEANILTSKAAKQDELSTPQLRFGKSIGKSNREIETTCPPLTSLRQTNAIFKRNIHGQRSASPVRQSVVIVHRWLFAGRLMFASWVLCYL